MGKRKRKEESERRNGRRKGKEDDKALGRRLKFRHTAAFSESIYRI